MRRLDIRTPALLLAIALGSGCDVRVGENGVSLDIAEGKATEEWVRTYSLPAGGRLEIVNVNGSIEVFPSASGQVEIRAERQAKARSDEAARELLAGAPIVENVSRDAVKVETPGAKSSRRGGGFGRSQVSVKYVVRVPPGLIQSFRTENGVVRLENVQGQFVASTTNGNVTAQDVSGSVSASTVNGGVQVKAASVTGPLDLTAVNGGIRLELPSDVRAEIDARAINGAVNIDSSLALVASEQSRLRLVGTIGGGGPRITAQTTNGGVRITMHGARASR